MAERKQYDANEVGRWPRPRRIETLKDHFAYDWAQVVRHTSPTKTGSGYNAVKVFKTLDPKLILDIGCGNNMMKKYIPNTIGIDLLPYDGNADIVDDVLNFMAKFKDNTVCGIRSVGPYNFGTELEIKQLIGECKRILKPGGLICAHARPGRKSDSTEFQKRGMIHYPWTRAAVHKFSKEFNLELLDPNPSVPDLKEPIIVEYTDVKQMSWDVLISYINRYDMSVTTMPDHELHINRYREESDVIDEDVPTDSPEEIHAVLLNELARREKDSSYDINGHDGVRPRFNWWWKKNTSTN